MSEPDTKSTTSGKSSTSTSRLKKLTSGSTWVSPFRNSTNGSAAGKDKNLIQKYKQSNDIDQIKVPKKFATHPTLEAEKKQKAASNASTKTLDSEAAAINGAEKATEASPEDKTSSAAEIEPKEAGVEAEAGSEAEKDTVEATEPKEEEEEETSGEAELEPETRPETEEAAETADATESAPVADAEETAEETPVETTEAPEESAETPAALEATSTDKTDNIEEQIKENPLEIVTQPEAKFEPVELPNQATLDSLKDKPILLNRYKELNAAALGSVDRTLDDPNKIIDLGSGLRMTQQQLLDIAAKRVAPVLATLNDEVEKTRHEDEIKRQQELDSKVKTHEGKLQVDFDKYAKKVLKKKEKFTQEIEAKLSELTRRKKTATTNAAEFEKTTQEEIETAKTDFQDRETKAVEKHGTDKETLEKNHEELEATKKQELEDSKTNQEKTTQEIEELHERKSDLANKNSDLSTEVEELTAQLAEEEKKLEELKSQHSEKEALIFNNLATKEELNKGLAQSKEDLEAKQKKHNILSAEVGALAGTVGAYAAHLGNLHKEKDQRANRLHESKTKFSDWQSEKQELAKKVALENEQKRLQATQEYENRKHEEELERQRVKEEKERLEKEEAERKEKEEAERQAREEAERKEKEEAERKAKEEAERKEKEEAERKAQLEAERKEKEAAEKKQKEEADRKRAQEEEERKEREAKEASNSKVAGAGAAGIVGGSFLGNSSELGQSKGAVPSSHADNSGTSVPASSGGQALPQSKSAEVKPKQAGDSEKAVESPVSNLANKEKDAEQKKDHKIAAGIGGAGVGLGAGAAASNIQSNGSSGDADKRSNSISSRFKKLGRKITGSSTSSKDSDESAKESSAPKPVTAKVSNPSAVSISKQPEALKNEAASAHSSEYDTYSIYEEVSDGEYYANKNDPNYLEMTPEELAKHKVKA